MKDLTGRIAKVGDYFSYPGRSGSNLWVTVFEYLGEKDGKAKARQLLGQRNMFDYKKYEDGVGFRDMTPEEIAKVDAKVSTLQCFNSYAVLIKDFNGKMC